MNFEHVIQHLEVIERMHRSNALTAQNADEVKKCEALAAEYKAAREKLMAEG